LPVQLALRFCLDIPGTALAYEFSEHERQVEADGRQQRMQSQQQLDNAMQAERQQDQRWQRKETIYPQAYNPPALGADSIPVDAPRCAVAGQWGDRLVRTSPIPFLASLSWVSLNIKDQSDILWPEDRQETF
jgi:hypothetical protein